MANKFKLFEELHNAPTGINSSRGAGAQQTKRTSEVATADGDGYKKRKKMAEFEAMHNHYTRQFSVTNRNDGSDDFVRSFLVDSQNYIRESAGILGRINWKEAVGSDKQDTRTKAAENMRRRASDVRAFLMENQADIDDDKYKLLMDYLDDFDSDFKSISRSLDEMKQHYSKWNTEEDYNRDVEAALEYHKLLNTDLEAEQKEIDYLERLLDEYDILSRTMTDERGTARLEEIQQQYGTTKDLKRAITERRQNLTFAQRAQEGSKLSSPPGNDDFNKYSVYTSTKNDGAWSKLTSRFGMGYDDLTYEYINGGQNGMRDEILRKGASFAGEQFDYDEFMIYDNMDDDEIAVYNYHYAKDGKDAAEKYLDSIRYSLNEREATATFEKMEDKPALELLFGIESGADQFQQSSKDLVKMVTGDDSYRPPSADQMLSGMVGEDLREKGGAWGVAYDLLNTTTNMAPSILTSVALSILNPKVGQVVGNLMMGGTAAGSAYQEAINNGYTKEQARLYGTLIGVSETALNKLLGSIGAFGGKVSTKSLTAMLDGVSSGFLRVAGKLGLDMGSEGIEEGLQDVLETLFSNWILHTDEKINWGEAGYSALLGSLSALALEGGTTIYNDAQTTKQGKELLAAGISPERLRKLGSTFSADSVAYQLAGKVNENTGAYTMAKLFEEAGAELTEANKADIQRSLEQKGMSSHDAEVLANGFADAVVGGLSETQQRILEVNDVLAQTVKEVIIDPNSTANQRSLGYKEMLRQLADQTAAENAARQASSGQAVHDKLMALAQEKAAADMDSGEKKAPSGTETVEGKDIHKDTQAAVSTSNIKTITKDGVVFAQKDGTEVSSKDVDFADAEDALLFEAFTEMRELSTEQANEIVKIRRETGGSGHFFTNVMRMAYEYGYANQSDAVLLAKTYRGNIPNETVLRFYNIGKEARQAEDSRRAQAPKAASGGKTAVYRLTEAGEVKQLGEGKEALKELAVNERRSIGVKTAQFLQKIGLGGNYYFVKSYVGKDGKRVFTDRDGKTKEAHNGMYYSNGDIYIDLNAGGNSSGITLFTLSHELAHFIQQWNPEKYKVLADFLAKHYAKQGVSAYRAVKMKQQELADARGTFVPFEEAYHEFVADSLSTMFSDGNLYEKLLDLKKTDKLTFNKIRSYIKKLAEKAKAFYSGEIAPSLEGQFMQLQSRETIDHLQQLFADALVGASENYRTAETQKNTDQEVGVQYSDGETLAQAANNLATISDEKYLRDKSEFPFVLVMDHTPQKVLDSMKNDNGVSSAKNRRIIIRRDALYLAIREDGIQEGHYHGLGADVIKKLPQYLEQPDAILQTDGSASRRLVLTHIEGANGQAIVSVEFESVKDFDGKNEYFNVIITVFDLHQNYLKGLFKKREAVIKYEKEDLAQVNPQLHKWLRTFNAMPSNNNIAHSDTEVKQNSDVSSEPISNRTLLVNAFDGLAQHEVEQKYLREYRETIEKLDAEEQKLRELSAQIRELSFSKGPRDKEKLRILKDKAQRTANHISVWDGKLLRLETSTPLRNVLERAKKSAYQRGKAKGEAALDAYRKRTEIKEAETLRERRATSEEIRGLKDDSKIMEREFIRLAKRYEAMTAQNERKAVSGAQAISDLRKELREEEKRHGTDEKTWEREFNRLLKEYEASGRKVDRLEEKINYQRNAAKKKVNDHRKTEMRHKIRKVVHELDSLLQSEDKKRHVPDALKKAVASALDMVKMTSYDADEKIAKYKELIAKATDADLIQSYQDSIISIQDKAEAIGKRVKELHEGYMEIANSDDPDIAAGYDSVIDANLKELADTIGNTPLSKMSLEQLEDVYAMYRAVLIRVRDANKSLADEKNRSISDSAKLVAGEVKSVGGEHTHRIAALDMLKRFSWDNLKPVYAFEIIGSKTLGEIFANVRHGEDVWARDVTEARAYFADRARKYKYDSWDMEKQFKFTSTSGKNFELNLNQILSLYAYSKREKAHDHLRLGGFVFDNNIETHKQKDESGKSLIKYKVNTADAYQISPEILAEIISSLSSEQRAFVDEMQEYLSSTMGAKGNEVTMKMYGIKLFKEKFYFPLKSAKQYMFEQNEVAGEVKIKNSGFTNKTKPQANNPVILMDFMDVWAGHVNDMSMYHAFTLPLEDFNRVFNYNSPKKEGQPTESVKGVIQNAYGPAAVNYVKQLITDLNGGARVDATTGIINKSMGLYKKGAVFASASVTIQQLSAVPRAMALIDAKYFVDPKTDPKRRKDLWDEVKRYAPVAIIKEMGYFDTNMGKSTKDFITGKEYDTFSGKMKALVKDSNYRDEVLSKLPALMDEVGWCSIWEAVKRETFHSHPNLNPRSESFLKLVGDRFTEVVVKTQVYDSVLSRSALMRSKDTGMKMATAFMAEPTTSINMIADALVQGKRGDRKYARKTIGAVVASQIINSMLVSIVYAGRDDDEDEHYWEKYLETLTGEIFDSLNPATYIPFVKDVVSIAQGYEVERSDMAVISDLWNAWQHLDSDNVSGWEKVEGFAGSVLQLFGLPLKNIMRDARALYQAFESFGRKITAAGVGYAVKSSLPKWLGGEKVNNRQQLYEAYLNGDKAHIARVTARYKDASAVSSDLRQALRENDPRIKEAAQAHFDNDLQRYESIFNSVLQEGYFEHNDIYSAIMSEVRKLEKEGAPETSEETDAEDRSLYSAGKYFDALLAGKTESAKIAHDKLVETELDEGYLPREAENNVKSALASQIGSAYKNGEIDREMALKLLIENTDKGETDVKKWDFEMKYGYPWSGRDRAYRKGAISENELVDAIMDIEGETRTDAKAYIKFIKLAADYSDTEITADEAAGYFEFAEPARIALKTYLSFKSRVAGLTSDKDANGKTTTSKKEKVMNAIHAMSLTTSQKDALYYAAGYKESTIDEAPWHQ